MDVETHDWLEQEPTARHEARRARGDLTDQCKGHQHIGPFGHVAWSQPWETEYQRIIQLGWCTLDAAGAILMASENAVKCALEAIQALGGAGYTKDYPVERLLRDAKLYDIGAGTNEIRRFLIGRELIGG